MSKRSKITKLDYDKEWKTKDGDTFHQFRITFENGDDGGASFKTKEPWCKVGDDVEYDGPEGQYKRMKLIRPQGGGRGFGGGAPRNERAIIAQSSMDRAVELVCHQIVKPDQMFSTAEKIMAWVCEKGGVK